MLNDNSALATTDDVKSILRTKLTIKFNQNTNEYVFIEERALENVVCKMSAILSRLQWVDISLFRVQAHRTAWYTVTGHYTI